MDLKEIIDDAGYRYDRLAEKLGLTKSHLSHMLAGRKTMPNDVKMKILRLCKAQQDAEKKILV